MTQLTYVNTVTHTHTHTYIQCTVTTLQVNFKHSQIHFKLCISYYTHLLVRIKANVRFIIFFKLLHFTPNRHQYNYLSKIYIYGNLLKVICLTKGIKCNYESHYQSIYASMWARSWIWKDADATQLSKSGQRKKYPWFNKVIYFFSLSLSLFLTFCFFDLSCILMATSAMVTLLFILLSRRKKEK